MSDYVVYAEGKIYLLSYKDILGRMTSKLIVDSSHCNELMINTDEIFLSSVTDTTSLLVACPELPPSAAPRMFSLSILSLFTRFREPFALVVATVV